MSETITKKKTSVEKETLIETMENDIDQLKNADRFQEMYKYVGFLYDQPASLLDYLPAHGIVILDEMSRLQESALNLDTEEAEWYSTLLEANRMVKGSQFSFDWQTTLDKIKHRRLYKIGRASCRERG